MKPLRIALIVLASLAGLFVILSLAGPAHISVERSATVSAPVSIVFAEVNSLQRWPKWDPWSTIDPEVVNEYSGPESGVGNVNVWRSTHKQVGNGRQEITASVDNARIDTHISFDGQGDANSYMEFTPQGEATAVRWVMSMDIPFAGRAFMLFMDMDKLLGADFEKGLAGLDAHCRALAEQAAAEAAAEEVTDEEAGTAAE